jgi:hypothetical protein
MQDVKTDFGVVNVGIDNNSKVNALLKVKDIDHEYDWVLKFLENSPPKRQKHEVLMTQEDYYYQFHTRVVLIWLITNLALIIGILNSNTGIRGISVTESETRANIYFTIGNSFFVTILLMVSSVECSWTCSNSVCWCCMEYRSGLV